MTQIVPVDCRHLKAGDRVNLCGVIHLVHRVRFAKKRKGSWWICSTELLHEIVGEPGLIQTTVPQGAKINIVVPL